MARNRVAAEGELRFFDPRHKPQADYEPGTIVIVPRAPRISPWDWPMSEPSVARWKQRGRVCAWKHKQRHTDWNLAADETACEALLDLFDGMKHGRWRSQASLALITPLRTATGAPQRRAIFASALVVKHSKSADSDDLWSLEETGSTLKITAGAARLQQLRDSVSDVKDGGGDYSIGSKAAPLWIWWFVD